MKNIVRTIQRLISIFLVLAASSMVFLSSPAIAVTSSIVTVTDKNVETEVIESSKSKPVIALLIQELWMEDYEEIAKADAEKFSGDKYKIVIGKTEENRVLSKYGYSGPSPLPLFSVIAAKNGNLVGGVSESDNFPKLFESIIKQVDKTS